MNFRATELLALDLSLAMMRDTHQKEKMHPTLAVAMENASKRLDTAIRELIQLGYDLERLRSIIERLGCNRPDRYFLATVAYGAGRTVDALSVLTIRANPDPRSELSPKSCPNNSTNRAPIPAHGQRVRKEVPMQTGLNEVRIIGRLGKDPIIKHGTNSGTPYCYMSIACEEVYTDKQNERKSHVEWVPIICYGKTAENCAKHLAKGSLVCVLGKVSTSKSKNDKDEDVYNTRVKAQRVVFLSRKVDTDASKPEQPAAGEDMGADEDLGPAFPSEASGMDDVPF